MLDGVSLDQLRAFIASVDEGSFSAAARKLRRAQSAVSDLVGGLEGQMGVKLFDRSGRYPQLTRAGVALLTNARGIVGGVDFMKARAKGMSSGLEPELSVAMDMLFPMAAITDAATEFQTHFPGTPLRLFVEALGAGYQRILDGTVSVGLVPGIPNVPSALSSEHLAPVALIMVASRHHPLAAFEGPIPKAELAKHVQLVVTDRSAITTGVEFAVISPATWSLTDLSAKHAFLMSGLGWGGMPVHAVRRDIADGKLVELALEDVPPGGALVSMSAAYATARPPGPAGRWLIDRLKCCPGGPTVAE